jgi:hypothetical protein
MTHQLDIIFGPGNGAYPSNWQFLDGKWRLTIGWNGVPYFQTNPSNNMELAKN